MKKPRHPKIVFIAGWEEQHGWICEKLKPVSLQRIEENKPIYMSEGNRYALRSKDEDTLVCGVYYGRGGVLVGSQHAFYIVTPTWEEACAFLEGMQCMDTSVKVRLGFEESPNYIKSLDTLRGGLAYDEPTGENDSSNPNSGGMV